MNIRIRAYQTDDAPLIYNSWSKNDWYSSKKPIVLFKRDWFSAKIAHIKNALKNGQAFVACLDGDPSFIVGYAVFNENSLEFVYVKKDYRKQGIGSLLKKQVQTKEKDDGEELPGSDTKGSLNEDVGEGHSNNGMPLPQ